MSRPNTKAARKPTRPASATRSADRSASDVALNSVGYQTRSVVRALQIMDAFVSGPSILSVKDLHEALELPKPTVSRLAGVLAERGFLRRVEQGFQLGPKTFQLGSIFARHYHVADGARPVLEATARTSLQTCTLGVLSGRDVVYLVVATPPTAVHHVAEPGGGSYAHATACGKAILATMAPDVRDQILGKRSLPRKTPHTISDRAVLDRELQRVCERGYAVDREETDPGLACIGIAIDLPGLGPAAISVSGPVAEYPVSAEKRLVPVLRDTATVLESSLGRAATFDGSSSTGGGSGA